MGVRVPQPASHRTEGADLRRPRILALPQAVVQREILLVADCAPRADQDAGGPSTARSSLGGQSRSGAGGAHVAAGEPGGLTSPAKSDQVLQRAWPGMVLAGQRRSTLRGQWASVTPNCSSRFRAIRVMVSTRETEPCCGGPFPQGCPRDPRFAAVPVVSSPGRGRFA